jgi:hypothetical protein
MSSRCLQSCEDTAPYFVAFVCAVFFSVLTAIADNAPATNKLDWWSFKPSTKPAAPAVAESKWARNEIDRFILTKLTGQKLTPSPEADRRTLIRRVTFNLIGLPPAPEEVAAFLNDTSTNAYETVVDRLLASPRYGERWARHWLDTVHYGESHGYDKDKPRLNAWPYRDYVVRAFNTDKPYSRFVEEQLAADMLFPDEPQLIPALGFIAAGPWDFVGHVELPISKTDGLIARYNDRDDMVMNAMSTFQSLTVHCARCHDHKFDPISARDYYSLQAVFAGVDRADRPFDADAAVAKRRRELYTRVAELKTEHARLDAEVMRLGGDELRTLDTRIARLKKPAKPDKAALGYHSQIVLTPDVEKWVQLDLGESREMDRVVFVGCHDDFNNIGAGFGFPIRYRIEISDDAEFRMASMVQDTAAAVPNPGVNPQTVRVGQAARYVRFTATKLAPRKDDYIFALAELMVLDANGRNIAQGAKVTALDSIEALPRWHKENLVDGHYFGVETNAFVSNGLAELESKREILLERLVPQFIRDALAANERATKGTEDSLSRLPKPQMVYAAASEFTANGAFIPPKGPRSVHLLRRGDVKRLGEEMKPSGVAAVPGVPAEFQISDLQNEGARRVALAKWTTHTNNILTRRSIVNRVWAYHFGRGIVETPNDFGRMGALPSHPELLDWLAFWFLENGESLKKLHRLIVTSATYRQSSLVESRESKVDGSGNPALDSRPSTLDSANRLLWCMNRARLDAEQFHDALLAVSGELDFTMGGPSIQQFYFKDDHSPVYDYARHDLDGPGANRRSIYRFIVRSVPDPLLDALDCPDANTLTPVRNVTTTALQALATLNDAFVLRQCERFAGRLSGERKGMDEQIVRAYEIALSRQPSDNERQKLVAHAQKHGLSSACRVLFNSNEFMFID